LVPAAQSLTLTPEDLDPLWVLASLLFLAAFAAGAELSQMTAKPKYRPDQKGAALALVLLLAALFLMYFFGAPPPEPS
jgi:hypothetical protein